MKRFINRLRYKFSPSFREKSDRELIKILFSNSKAEALIAEQYAKGKIGTSNLFDSKIIN